MEQEEHLEKVLQACEGVEQLEVAKQQQQAQLEEEPEEEEEGRKQEQVQKEENEEEEEKKEEEKKEELLQKGAEAQGTGEPQEQQPALEGDQERRQGKWVRQEKERLLSEPEEKRRKEDFQHQEQKELTEEQVKAKDIAAAAGDSKGGPKINPDNYGLDLNSENSTNDKSRAEKRVPVLFEVPQLSPELIRQLCQPLPPNPYFESFRSRRAQDVFNKSKLQDQTPKTTPKDS
ncbi:inner centromere protein-like [Trichosurus vulpecula]|uniref:inner centromere protein-like n=1 Tax=Trichosurus vulpecula TaxID=9337 RepID=UPI00186B52BD|nr:inner centromere protein-like [Trichosurus vulpecula]